jgi:tetratricopeptide (TPR) repeat protein
MPRDLADPRPAVKAVGRRARSSDPREGARQSPPERRSWGGVASLDETVADPGPIPDTVPETARRPELDRGATVGRYVVLDRLGVGGMGVVHAAYDPELDRKIALKLLHPERTGDGDGSARRRLLREAQAMAKLQHPNVAAVHDVGVHGDGVFLAMELIDGETARVWAARGAHGWREVVRVYLQAARGLAAAHSAGLVHRDFKPDNVMIDRQGRVRVMDFGLARAADDEPEAAASGSRISRPVDPALSTPLTEAGAIMGTPAYMAPEQHVGLQSDARSDQFSFCVALFEALWGKRPFAGETHAALALQVTQGRVREPARRGVPGRLRRAVLRGLSVAPDDRWPDMGALLRELEGASRRKGPWLALAGAAVAASVAALVVGGADPIRAACVDAGAAAPALWNERRDAVRVALTGAGTDWTEGVWARVEPHLSAYADEWERGRIDACERAAAEPELADDRAACHHERLAAYRALLDVLAAADAEVVTRAVQAAGGLPPLADCADPAWLVARVKPPADPATREQVEIARAELARGQALELAGRYADAGEVAAAIEARARDLDHPPLLAEAMYLRGSLLDRGGDVQAARDTLAEAYFLAAHGEHEEIMGRAAITLVYVFGNGLARIEDAELWARHADVVAERRPGLAGDLASARAAALVTAGRWQAAVDAERRALDLRRAHLGPRHPSVFVSLNNLGAALQRMGRDEDALPVAQEALAMGEELLGPDHPDVAVCRENLGVSLGELGRWSEAVAPLERAMAARQAAFGDRHPAMASSWLNLGVAHASLGDLERGLALTRKAVELREAVVGLDHPHTALAWHNLGSLLCKHGEREAGCSYHERAIATIERLLGPEHTVLGELLTAHADCLPPADAARAIELLERATTLARAGEVEPAVAARTHWVLGRVLWESRRDRERAAGLIFAARDTWRAQAPRDADSLRELEAWLSQDDRPSP